MSFARDRDGMWHAVASIHTRTPVTVARFECGFTRPVTCEATRIPAGELRCYCCHTQEALARGDASDALCELAELLGADPDDPAGVICALRERLRECERITARNVVLEARRLRAVDVLEGRA